jgi:hypothetical protein
MPMKLTLSLDKELIEFAHRLARESNDSISNMVSTLLRNAMKNRMEPPSYHPSVRQLYGYTRKKPLPDKEEMRKEMLKKHL